MALERLTDDRVDSAMAFLAETDAEFAAWRSMVLRTEYMAEVAESMAFLSIREGTVEDRKKAAKIAEETKKAMDEHFVAVTKFRTLEARRAREVLVIECWRTLQANRRQGNL